MMSGASLSKASGLVVMLLIAACATPPKVKKPAPDADKQSEFDKGLRALEVEDYSEASRVFEHLLLEKPGRDMDLVTLYNAGAAFEGLGDCQKASERYRQVVRSSAGHFKRIEGEALFHLSLMYECLGDDAKTVTALLDARRRAKDLPVETVGAEIPARLAAAYARLGNRDKALEYFNLASRGLKQVVAKGGAVKVQQELISRTLFMMGQLSGAQRRADGDATAYLQSLQMQQPYLLQAIELDHPQWAPKAESELNLAYDNLWKFRFGDQVAQRDFYTRGLQTINELRKIRMPSRDPRVESLFAKLDQTESQLQGELSKVAAATRLTPEAERREGIRREGKLVDPDAKKGKPSVKKE